MGELHARVYADSPRTTLVGVTDHDADRARAVAERLSTTAYRDVEELLRVSAPDVVTVAVPETQRFDPAVAAAEAGASLLLEKPLAPDLAQADRLVAALSAHPGLTVMVNFPLQSESRYLRVADDARRGRFGALCSLSARRRGVRAAAERYGPWTDLVVSTAIHDIDAMTWIAGAPVQRVYAEGVSRRCAEWGHEDAVVATMRFADGCVGQLEASWVLPDTVPTPLASALHVLGDGGMAVIEGTDHGLEIVDGRGLERPDMTHWPVGPRGVEGPLRDGVEHFVDCVLDGAQPRVGLREARAAQAVTEALRRSLRDGVVVVVDSENRPVLREEQP